MTEMKTYKVCWGPDQYTALGSHVIVAKSEKQAKSKVKKLLQEIYGVDLSWHNIKILYAVEIEKRNLL